MSIFPEAGSAALEAQAILGYCLPLENHREIIVWGAPEHTSAAPKLNETLVMNLFLIIPGTHLHTINRPGRCDRTQCN